ncbi:CubicO group peptidase (beta-lactamase class C family) [Duganella sp. 1224]|uniref:serine hydrolase domain-containing protein n=1 Tax=Duganella sp. 1224 TaxID=2587052 RepID=UPI0015C7D058|nr:serine hydrolase domain-containing protein [Duganella sp. 1224]NYE59802.1 CubicO group peptidase (beta-lactamase class C family) [Duganella sp. 1224]
MKRRHFLCGSAATLLGASAFANNPVAEAFAARQPFYGLVMLARRGMPVSVQTFGLSNIEDGTPVREDTRFAVGSISKWLTTTTVLKLVESGKLDLDVTIGKLLPWYRADGADKVTLRHLLSNASGIPNQFTPALKADPEVRFLPLTTRQAIDRFCSGELIFPPGSRFDYVSTNWYIVIGIIEAATGMPYQQAMRAITLDPLNLSATSTDRAGAAEAYATIQPPARKVDAHQHYMVASGGYYSSATDLLNAARAVFNGGFLSPQSLQAMTHIEVPSENYTLGGRVKTLERNGQRHTYAWETGRTGGYRAVLGHRLDGEETVIILNNTDLSQKTMDEFAYDLLGATLPK